MSPIPDNHQDASEVALQWLVTERLRAGRWVIDLAESAFSIYGDPVAMRFMRPNYPVSDVAAMRARLEEIIARNERYQGRMGSWPLFVRETDTMVGAILLKPLPGSEQIEVGWHLGRAHWGNGYATEAGRAALNYGYNCLRLKTIYAVVDPANTPSMAVCRRIGMTHLGRTEQFYERSLEYFSKARPT